MRASASKGNQRRHVWPGTNCFSNERDSTYDRWTGKRGQLLLTGQAGRQVLRDEIVEGNRRKAEERGAIYRHDL